MIYGDRFRLCHMHSLDAAKLFADESVDFIYVDGDHTFKCRLDLDAWYPKVIDQEW